MNAGPGDLSWWFDAPMANPLLSLALLAAVGSVALPLVSFVKSRPRVAAACAVLLVAVGVLAVSAGVWVQANELRHVEWALPNASPADRESIRLAGAGRARTSLVIGLFGALLPLAGACICLGRALAGRASRLAAGGGLALALASAVGIGSVAQGQYRLGKAEVAQSVRLQGGARISARSSAEASSDSRAAWLVIPLAVGGVALLVAARKRREVASPLSRERTPAAR